MHTQGIVVREGRGQTPCRLGGCFGHTPIWILQRVEPE
jgi:hypothetical protein